MSEKDLIDALINTGTASLIAVFMIVAVYRLLSSLGAKFIEVEQNQADALGAQAQAMTSLTVSVREFMDRDMTEHREMLVLLRFMAQQQRHMEEVIIED